MPKDDDYQGTAREALEKKADKNPQGLSQGEHVALAIYYLGDVLLEGMGVELEDEDE